MLLKNKFYFGFITLLFVVNIFLVANENIIGNPSGERVFYIITILIFVLMLVGLIQKRRH